MRKSIDWHGYHILSKQRDKDSGAVNSNPAMIFENQEVEFNLDAPSALGFSLESIADSALSSRPTHFTKPDQPVGSQTSRTAAKSLDKKQPLSLTARQKNAQEQKVDCITKQPLQCKVNKSFTIFSPKRQERIKDL